MSTFGFLTAFYFQCVARYCNAIFQRLSRQSYERSATNWSLRWATIKLIRRVLEMLQGKWKFFPSNSKKQRLACDEELWLPAGIVESYGPDFLNGQRAISVRNNKVNCFSVQSRIRRLNRKVLFPFRMSNESHIRNHLLNLAHKRKLDRGLDQALHVKCMGGQRVHHSGREYIIC